MSSILFRQAVCWRQDDYLKRKQICLPVYKTVGDSSHEHNMKYFKSSIRMGDGVFRSPAWYSMHICVWLLDYRIIRWVAVDYTALMSA